jgi:hypothetical protein
LPLLMVIIVLMGELANPFFYDLLKSYYYCY